MHLTLSGHMYLSAIALGAFWHQVTFAVHDLAHVGATGSYVSDRIISILLADGVGGLSVSWWADVRVDAVISS